MEIHVLPLCMWTFVTVCFSFKYEKKIWKKKIIHFDINFIVQSWKTKTKLLYNQFTTEKKMSQFCAFTKIQATSQSRCLVWGNNNQVPLLIVYYMHKYPGVGNCHWTVDTMLFHTLSNVQAYVSLHNPFYTFSFNKYGVHRPMAVAPPPSQDKSIQRCTKIQGGRRLPFDGGHHTR